MRVLLIGGNPGRWNYADPDRPYTLTNGIEAWVNALQGDYYGGRHAPKRHEMAPYDLVIANLNPWLIPEYVPLAENRPSGQQWVTLLEGAGEDYLDPTPGLLRVLNASDLVATINRRVTAYIRTLCRSRVEWIGIPYPVAEIEALATPAKARREQVLVCPRRYRAPSFMVAEALELPTVAYFVKVSRKLSNLPLFFKHRYYGRDLLAHLWLNESHTTARIALLERELPDFWREAGACQLWVNLDPRTTWARYVLDAAALGVPIISTESTAHAPLLFPETTVRDVYCIEEAIEIGRRLLRDEALVERVVCQARAGLEEFTAQACVRRLEVALSQ